MWPWVLAVEGCDGMAVVGGAVGRAGPWRRGSGTGGTWRRGHGPETGCGTEAAGSSGTLQGLFAPRYAMKCLDKKRIKMKQGETLALNERIMLSLVSTGVRGHGHRAELAPRLQAVARARGEGQ